MAASVEVTGSAHPEGVVVQASAAAPASAPASAPRLRRGSFQRRRSAASVKVVSQATRFDRLLVSFDGKEMRIKDEQMDVFFRYAFPLACAVFLVSFYAHVPNHDMPEQWPKCTWMAVTGTN